MQRERRRDPYPWTWEVPAAVLLVLVLVAGIQLGRSMANLVVGAGWTWPASSHGPVPSPIGPDFWTSLVKVLAGDAAAGLPSPVPVDLAGRGLVWVSVAATEATLLTLAIGLGIYVYHRWGPGRMRGMAAPAEAEKLLGVTRLRKVAGIVRPDMYGTQPPEPGRVFRQASDPHVAGASEVGAHAGAGAGAGGVEAAGTPLGRGMTNPWLVEGRTRKGSR